MTNPDDVVKQIKRSEANKIKVAITDIDGVMRGKYVHVNKFLSAAETGFGFCNVIFGWDMNDVAYDNVKYTGWHTGYPDAKVNLDLDTFRLVPWDNDIPFFLGEFVDSNDRPLPICPRQLLKQVVAQAGVSGYFPLVGTEFEWFNFRETPQSLEKKNFHSLESLTPGMFGYSLIRSSYENEYFNEIMDQLLDFDVPIEGLHTETGPGVYEAALVACDALEAADRAVLFKTSVKELANKRDIIASFMARWNNTLPGCSGHIHQSLCLENGTNAFYDKKDPLTMSDTFKSYIAGQLLCLPEILPMLAPTINSYKRLVEGFWAPTSATWGVDNRTAAVRVILGSKKATRMELRVGGADINPYLAIAATLAAGMYGIENKLELKEEMITGNAYEAKDAVKFPSSLEAATEKFANSKIAKELFGEVFVDHYANTRRWECKEFHKAVTDWELKRYFEII